jgi:preflagellin peptidase FlaK
VFVAFAVRDVRTRRIPGIYWTPLTVLGLGLLYLDWNDPPRFPAFENEVMITLTIGIGFVVSVSYLFYYVGAFGGADAQALMTIAILFPFYPELSVSGTALPLSEGVVPVFSLTILTNSVIGGVAYPLALGARNLLRGELSRKSVVGLKIRTAELEGRYGKLLETRVHDDSRDYLLTLLVPRRRGLDLDALRMYLRWRGLGVDQLRESPDYYRDPETIPEETNPPTDGNILDGNGVERDDGATPTARENGEDVAADYDDAWGAERFLAEIDGDAYGTRAETLRFGLDRVAESEEVWITPGIPFLVPVAIGICLSVTVGDLLAILVF